MAATDPAPERYCPACEHSFPDGERCPTDDTPLVRLSSKDPLIGRDLEGRFELREKIGGGGMGVVYRAWQRSMGREVAVKVIRADLSSDAAAAKGFLREARLSSRIGQPSCVSVHEFGQTEDGLLYLVMEILRGRTLSQVLRSDGALPPARVIRIAGQICDALDAAHQLGIVHRDLKPSNVMVLDHPPGRDLVKVLDFGVARSLRGDDATATLSRGLVGTPAYLPAEVARGEAVDERSDLYSLGVMLYQMLLGRLPFEAESAHRLVAMHAVHDAPKLPDTVPEPLRLLVAQLLEKQPADRPPTAAAVRAILTGETTLTPTPRPNAPDGSVRPPATPTLTAESMASLPGGVPVPVPRRRKRWPWLAAGAALMAAAIAAVVVWRMREEPKSAAIAQVQPTLPSADPSPSPTPSATPAATPTPLPTTVRLALESQPSAQVVLDGVRLGKTPLTHETARGDKPVRFVFQRDGFKTTSKTVVPDRDQPVKVTLNREMFIVPP